MRKIWVWVVIIMQSGQPVAYASRRTSQAEQNYAPIENEMSAIVFECILFHDYVYGQQLTVEMDHKPLVCMVFQKPLNKLSPRLQCMRLKLLRYDVNVVEVNMVMSKLPILQGN